MIQPIAHIYWRSIKNGDRDFAGIPDKIKDDVRSVAYDEVLDGIISQDEYDKLIGPEI